MLEEYLIGNCSPTLASLKTANLFSMPYTSEEELTEQIAFWNAQMKEKGLSVILLRKRAATALVYVCRKTRLQENILKPGVLHFLERYGYRSTDADEAIVHLKERLREKDFHMRSEFFLAIRWEMLLALLKMQAGILNAPDAGRSTVMNVRP